MIRTGASTLHRARLRIAVALLAAAGALAIGTARAVDTEPPFGDPVLDERYQTLIHEVRCLVCQNETIADSNASLAGDLRREIRRMVAEGKSNKEVLDFLVARYGDFVLYRPPVQPTTWALWGAPAVFVLLGAVVFARVLRRRVAGNVNEDAE
jgi:cytochrome c-type biogenesis protein CcmH